MMVRRAAGIGVGDRTIFIDKKRNPSPDTYTQKSAFELDTMTSTAFYKGKKKSFCFGAGREDFHV